MPAAAVIPAPLAYTNVVAVKKLVVGYLPIVSRSDFVRVTLDTFGILSYCI